MKRFLLFSLVCVLLFSTGCSPNVGFFGNYRTIEQLQLVHTLGFDVHRDGVEVSVSGGEADSGGSDDSRGPGLMRLTATGSNITDTVARLQNFAGKEELYFAHARYVLIGEDYARQGLAQVIDYLEHSPQLRSDLPLFVVKGGTAKDVVTKAGGEKNSVLDMLESVVRSCARDGSGYPFTCGDIAIFNAEQGCALACALETVPTKQADDSAEEEDLTPLAAGYAIFKQGSLVGYLSREAARGVNLLLGQWDSEVVTIDSGGPPLSLQFQEVKVDLQPTFGRAGTLTGLTVAVELKAEAQNDPGSDREKVNRRTAEAIGQWLDEIFQAMRATGTDFLGFGQKLQLRHPQWQGDLTENIGTLPMKAEISCEVYTEDG